MRLKTKSIISIISLILFCVLLISDYSQATGSAATSANFLRIPVWVRETALGGTFSAVSDNSNAVYYNPVGLGLIERTEVSFSTINILKA